MTSVISWRDRRLRMVAKPVDEITPMLLEEIANMSAIVRHNGAGLAAPQVGIPLRFFVYQRMKGTRWTGGINVAINPVIEPYGSDVVMGEGCLSFPGLFHPMSRPSRCRMTFTGLQGKEQKLDVGGWMARVFQHEVDHLDGKLIVDDPVVMAKWQAIIDSWRFPGHRVVECDPPTKMQIIAEEAP